MPRRYADYMQTDGFTTLNQISTYGAIILGVSVLPFLWNVYITWRRAPLVNNDDPWGFGASLEWATSCPPPRHNFSSLPRIRSERPALDLHYPELAALDHANQQESTLGHVFGQADLRGSGEEPPTAGQNAGNARVIETSPHEEDDK